ncbi:MAG: exopolyphosphatase, partial [Pseudomonadota bacterium]
MIVARVLNGQLHVLDRLQQMVRLAAGLDEKNHLDKASRERALECLSRFGERLRGMPPGAVRAVGTNTLRRARNAGKFLAAAERALGRPIEIISGQEEARLIYQGVARHLADDDRQRLVLDIGGGSTEAIVGRRLEPLQMESLHIGCVGFSQRHFPKGEITSKAVRRAETAAR